MGRYLGQGVSKHLEGQLGLVRHSAKGLKHGSRHSGHEEDVDDEEGEVARGLAVLGPAHSDGALPVAHPEDDGREQGHESHEAHGLHHLHHRVEERRPGAELVYERHISAQATCIRAEV